MTANDKLDAREAEAVTLIREAFERSGRGAEKALLHGALSEMAWNARSGSPRDLAAYAIATTGLRVAPGAGPLEILPSGREDSVTRSLGVLEEVGRRLNARLVSIRQEAGSLRLKAVERRLASEGRPVPDDLVMVSRFCDGSPMGLCCCDGDEDPAKNDCLFCHRSVEAV